MSGIDGNFVNKYVESIKDDKLSNNEAEKLRSMAKSGGLDKESALRLKSIIETGIDPKSNQRVASVKSDGLVDENEKQLLLIIGSVLKDDNEVKTAKSLIDPDKAADVKAVKSATFDPDGGAVSKFLERGFQGKEKAVKEERGVDGWFEKNVWRNPTVVSVSNAITDTVTETYKAKEKAESAVSGFVADVLTTAGEFYGIIDDKTKQKIDSNIAKAGEKIEQKWNNAKQALKVETKEEEVQEALGMGITSRVAELGFRPSAESIDCIQNALTTISNNTKKSPNKEDDFTLKKVPSEAISPAFLKKATGKEWDGISISQQNQNGTLRATLEANKDTALVVVGTHTFVFNGFDKNGDLNVTDPSDGTTKRTISKDNPAAVAYVIGKGDGAATSEKLNKPALIKTPTNIDTIQTINSADRADKSGESWNTRKLLSTVVSDKEVLGAVSKAADGSMTLNRLQKTLANKGINLSEKDLAAMIKVIKTDIGGSNILDKLKEISNNKGSAQAVNYSFGIQYSDIDLKDYFKAVSPNDIMNSFKQMLEGKEGC